MDMRIKGVTCLGKDSQSAVFSQQPAESKVKMVRYVI